MGVTRTPSLRLVHKSLKKANPKNLTLNQRDIANLDPETMYNYGDAPEVEGGGQGDQRAG